MIQRASVRQESVDDDVIRPPRLPSFDGSRAQTAAVDTESEMYASSQLRLERGKMGVCLLIVADGVFFGSLLGLYVILRASRPEIFSYGHYFLDARVGAIHSCVLFASGLTGALAVRFSQLGRRRSVVASIVATLTLAVLFLGLQGVEYASNAERRLLPGSSFLPSEEVWETASFQRAHPSAARYAARFRLGNPIEVEPAVSSIEQGTILRTRESRHAVLGPLIEAGVLGQRAVYAEVPSEPRNAHLFFGLYFVTTGVHGLHVLVGTLAFAWLLWRARAAAPVGLHPRPVDGVALYWNLVLLMRVFLFPLFYLVH